jgi:hypothetical protein
VLLKDTWRQPSQKHKNIFPNFLIIPHTYHLHTFAMISDLFIQSTQFLYQQSESKSTSGESPSNHTFTHFLSAHARSITLCISLCGFVLSTCAMCVNGLYVKIVVHFQ